MEIEKDEDSSICSQHQTKDDNCPTCQAKSDLQHLEPCPCGQTPRSLNIDATSCKWMHVSGDCCGEWNVEFRTSYAEADTEECMGYAIKAWNHAKRKNERNE